jgi:hypothetical protein
MSMFPHAAFGSIALRMSAARTMEGRKEKSTKNNKNGAARDLRSEPGPAH